MMEPRRRALLTGATGNWGRAALREFRRHPEVTVVALVLGTAADRRVLAEFHDMPNLVIRTGDLTRLDDVGRAVADVDTILHVGAVVSPVADRHPDLAHRVNIGSMRNIIQAVRALPDPGRVAVVGIGSVAETGDRQEPHHWGRVGDPLRVSRFDEYGQTKIIAERLLIESGLPKWVWLRQTGILHPGMLAIRDPIITHVPMAGVMEWVSAEDSARLLVGLAAPNVPDTLWREVYNVGGGAGWRLTNWELQTAIAAAVGVPDVRQWYERDWFALKNFHGHWFVDSDRLQRLVPFREDTFDAALDRAVATLPLLARHAGRVPPWVIKNLVMRPLTRRPRGTIHAIRRDRPDEIAAYFGSRAAWRGIGGWSDFVPPAPSRTPTSLDHGYDETKPRSAWSATDYAGVATHRGGDLLSTDIAVGDLDTALSWRCGLGHQFFGSPRLIMIAGHWCPQCVRDTAGYGRQAEYNRFLAQVQEG